MKIFASAQSAGATGGFSFFTSTQLAQLAIASDVVFGMAHIPFNFSSK
jgi:hypothetical protein